MSRIINKKIKARDFQEYLVKQLKNPEVKKHYDEYGKQLEIAYQILQLRKQKKVSQVELAKRMGTKQSNIARMEAGQQNFSIRTLNNIARVLKADLSIRLS